MRKALYIPDANVRQLVEQVKNMNHFSSLRETVEEGMLSLMREHHNRQQPFEDIAVELQRDVSTYLGSRHSSDIDCAEHKAFFDELGGGI